MRGRSSLANRTRTNILAERELESRIPLRPELAHSIIKIPTSQSADYSDDPLRLAQFD